MDDKPSCSAVELEQNLHCTRWFAINRVLDDGYWEVSHLRGAAYTNAAFRLRDRSDRVDRIATIRSRTRWFQWEHSHCVRVAIRSTRSLRAPSVNVIVAIASLRSRVCISGIWRSRNLLDFEHARPVCYAKCGTCRRRVSVRPSVCLCVCVCQSHSDICVKTAKSRIMQIMPRDRPGTLVFK